MNRYGAEQRQMSTRLDSSSWHMPAGIKHGTWNMGCDIWLIHAHARCRHVVSQWEQLHRAQKDSEVIPQGWQRVVQRARHANQVPGTSRGLCDLSREPINFLISRAQKTAHERQARMAVWCLGEQRQGETQRNKLQAAKQALAAQKQYSTRRHEMNC